jgi:ABC-type nitrate/sulfonate/bicarbonate transport system substrate-binding protein
VRTFNVLTGLASKDAVLFGTADIGLVASTPMAMAAYHKESLIILASYIESRNLIALVAPMESNAHPVPVSPVAVVKGTISEFYLHSYLKKYHPEINPRSVHEIAVQPAGITGMLISKSAASAVAWEPWSTKAAQTNPGLKIYRAEDVYTQRIYIVTTHKALQKKRDEIERFVKCIDVVCQKLTNDKNMQARLIKYFPSDSLSIKTLFPKVDFSLKFDYENMKKLILEDGQSAFELGLSPKGLSGPTHELEAKELNYFFDHDFKYAK